MESEQPVAAPVPEEVPGDDASDIWRWLRPGPAPLPVPGVREVWAEINSEGLVTSVGATSLLGTEYSMQATIGNQPEEPSATVEFEEDRRPYLTLKVWLRPEPREVEFEASYTASPLRVFGWKITFAKVEETEPLEEVRGKLSGHVDKDEFTGVVYIPSGRKTGNLALAEWLPDEARWRLSHLGPVLHEANEHNIIQLHRKAAEHGRLGGIAQTILRNPATELVCLGLATAGYAVGQGPIPAGSPPTSPAHCVPGLHHR